MATYEDLGVQPVINAAGTLTKYGGSLMDPRVLEAMENASRSFVDMDELLRKSGQHIADLLGAEAALTTAGAAAAMAQATAACMTGGDPARIRSLPDTEEIPDEVVVMRCHRNPYDQAMRGVGARFVEIGNAIETLPWELEDAIGEETAAVAFFVQSSMLNASMSLEDVLDIAHDHETPVIVDAAAELPPEENLNRFTDMGADLVLFSGGKDLRGPQSSGLLLGREDLVACARKNGPPHHNIGRAMKIDKETVMGLTRAVELYLQKDHAEQKERWEQQAEAMASELRSLPDLEVTIDIPSQPYAQPALVPRVFLRFEGRKPEYRKRVREKLLEGEPPVVAEFYQDTLVLNPHALQEGQEAIVTERMLDILG